MVYKNYTANRVMTYVTPTGDPPEFPKKWIKSLQPDHRGSSWDMQVFVWSGFLVKSNKLPQLNVLLAPRSSVGKHLQSPLWLCQKLTLGKGNGKIHPLLNSGGVLLEFWELEFRAVFLHVFSIQYKQDLDSEKSDPNVSASDGEKITPFPSPAYHPDPATNPPK